MMAMSNFTVKGALLGAVMATIGVADLACAEKVSERCSAAEVAFPPPAADDAMSPLFAPPVRNFGATLSPKDVQAGWSGKAPTLETVIRYQQAPLSSALDCANVKSRAEKRGKIVPYQAGRSVLDRMGLKFGQTRYLYQVSMPVISQNGEEAIVEILAPAIISLGESISRCFRDGTVSG